MNKELLIKKCMKCGAIVKVIEDCKCGEDCGIKCCGEKMTVLKPNSVDAAVEKHVPTYEVKDGKIYARVNHVMEDEHSNQEMNQLLIASMFQVRLCMLIVINMDYG